MRARVSHEYLLGTKGSQLPSYVPCHAHYRLYNPSCDVTLFNPFITEPLRSLSFSSPLAILRRAQRSHGKTRTEKRIGGVRSGVELFGEYKGAERMCEYARCDVSKSRGAGGRRPLSDPLRSSFERGGKKMGETWKGKGARRKRATYRPR